MAPEFARFSELGIGIATLFILFLVVKYFISAMESKDRQIMELIREFKGSIDKLSSVITDLKEEIRNRKTL